MDWLTDYFTCKGQNWSFNSASTLQATTSRGAFCSCKGGLGERIMALEPLLSVETLEGYWIYLASAVEISGGAVITCSFESCNVKVK
jgi:hypothetical protein